nr:phage tail spike protein [Paeniclostridium ghonii]
MHDIIIGGDSCVEEERNGLFELSFDYPNNYPLSDQLIEENMIEVKPNDEQGLQKFRIYDTKCLMKNIITVLARHESFDLANDHVENINLENASCEYALNTLFRNSHFSRNYKGYSDIINAQNYNIDNVNILNAIAGKEGSIIDTYGTGAEILRDATNIHVLNKRGHDNDVIIEFGKNLTDFVLERDLTNLETRVGGFAKYTNADNKEVIVKSNWIDSPYINNFSHPYISIEGRRDYSDKLKDGEIPTVEKLNKLCVDEFLINKRDIPKSNYTIKFIPLSKCIGYEGLQDKVSLCDTVRIIDKRFNADTKAKVIRYKYNFIKERYESMELGEPRTTLGDIITSSDGKDGKDGLNGKNGEKGDKGDRGQDGKVENMPDTLPNTPTLESKVYGMGSVELSWTFENKLYYNYELYASKQKDFKPNSFDLIHAGQSSSFLFNAKPSETWYFKVCAVNSHQRRNPFSNQVEAKLPKVEDMNNYFSQMAIGKAVAQSITADYMEAGIIKGHWIDAKNLSVTDGNGKRTLDIDSFGRITMMPTKFKVLVDGKEEDIVTNTKFEVNNEQILIKVSNTAKANELENSMFSEYGRIWNISNINKCWYEFADWYGGIADFTSAIRLIDCTNDSVYANQKVYPKNPKMAKFSISGYAHYFNVYNTIGNGYPMCHWYCDVKYRNGESSYHNYDVRDYAGNDQWTKHQWTINTLVGVHGAIDYIDFYVYKRNTTGDFRTSKLYMHEGDEELAWKPSGEIYSNNVLIDGEGMQIVHDNGSKSVFNHESIKFLSSKGATTLKVKDGGLNFYTYGRNPEMVGFIKSSVLGDTDWNGATLSTYGCGDYVSIGTSDSFDENSWKSNTNIMITPHGYIDGFPAAGTYFMNKETYFKTKANFKDVVEFSSTLYFNSGSNYPHMIYNSTNNNFCIMGDNCLTLGIRYGNNSKTALEIVEDESQLNKAYSNFWTNLNMHGHRIENVNLPRTLSAQSFALKANTKDINESYATTSMTDGEIRHTERKTQIISNKTLIVELPQIFAENIENDYHVNISKMSWGDYKIVDKNPYYFKIETNVDNFAFTYEVVAKQIEKPSGYAIIANSQYRMMQEYNENKNPEQIKTIIEV